MSFIHPLLLGGLLLVGVPVLIHLIMQEKPKHLLFPAFRFLMQRYRTNQRKLRLRHLLLLLLRMLLIALFCMALARPRLFSERIGVGSERPVAAVLLFDTSYSVEYKSGERNCLDEAKRLAGELLRDLPDGSRVAVLDSGDAGGEWLASLSQARSQIDGLKLKPNSGPVSRMLGQAYRLLEELEQEQEPGTEPLARFVYVFSDRTQASWDANDVKNLKQPEGVRAAFVDVGVTDPYDLALGNPELPVTIVAPGDSVEVRVPVRATGMAYDTVIGLQIDEEPEDKRQVKLQSGQGEVIVFRQSVGKLAAGPHQVRVRLASSDALPFNNECFAAFEMRAGRSILLVTDQLREAAVWKAALEVKGFRCTVKTIEEAQSLAPGELLANYPAVCLLSVADPAAGLNRDMWAKLREYVQKGGGLAIIPGGDELKKDSYNSDAASQVLPGEFVRIVVLPDKQPGATWNEGESRHPLMIPFKEWRKNADVDFQRELYRPRAVKYWEIKPYPGETDFVVRYAEEPYRPALVERKLGLGRVLLFTVPLDRRQPAWQNYWNESSFGLVLADKAVGYLAGDADKVNFNYLSGQPVTIQFPTAQYFPLYTLIGPGLTGTETNIQRAQGQNTAQVTQAVMPGQYSVYDSKGTLVSRFAVNVRAEESQLDNRVPVEQIETLFGPNTVVTVEQGTSLREALQGRWLQPLELFPWMMIALLFALAFENLLSNKFYRQPAQQNDGLTG